MVQPTSCEKTTRENRRDMERLPGQTGSCPSHRLFLPDVSGCILVCVHSDDLWRGRYPALPTRRQSPAVSNFCLSLRAIGGSHFCSCSAVIRVTDDIKFSYIRPAPSGWFTHRLFQMPCECTSGGRMMDRCGVRFGGGVIGWTRRGSGSSRKTEGWLSAPANRRLFISISSIDGIWLRPTALLISLSCVEWDR